MKVNDFDRKIQTFRSELQITRSLFVHVVYYVNLVYLIVVVIIIARAQKVLCILHNFRILISTPSHFAQMLHK